jgi:WD40 repeat protein
MMTAEPLPAKSADTGSVDAENPWPGLAAFREADQEFFHGREAETGELFRLVLRDRLTIFFGLSGLGKTSLLQAGLFPRLRQENVFPVRIRLDFASNTLPLIEQVRDAIRREAGAAGVEAPELRPGETLWELFHRQGADFWSARNRLVTPALVFDQFEEIFTLGRKDPDVTRERGAFLDEIASLCEGSPPPAVRLRLDEAPSEARDFAFNRHPYKILLSLREDFLAELEGLRGRIRSIVFNRFRLCRMNGANALGVVTGAGGHLVDADTAGQIVRFVAGQPEGNETPLDAIEVEPALLSVVCRELNNKRKAQGAPRITADLLEGNRDKILTDFYERSLESLDPRVQMFIEERLLTTSGFRNSVALEDALVVPGVTPDALDELTDRRLLRIEERSGLPRIELTHDVLTGVIRASRDRRRERETREKAETAWREAEEREKAARRELRRQHRIGLLLAGLLTVVLGLAAWAWVATANARKALSVSDEQKASNLRGVRPEASLAYLARAIRTDNGNVSAQTAGLTLLLRESWPLLLTEIRHGQAVHSAQISSGGRLLLSASADGTVRLWDAKTGNAVGPPLQHGSAVSSASFSGDGRKILSFTFEGGVFLWDVATRKALLHLAVPRLLVAELKRDGSLLATSAVAADSSGSEVTFWDARSGTRLSSFRVPGALVSGLTFSPDGLRVATAEMSLANAGGTSGGVALRDLRDGSPLHEPASGAAVLDVAFRPDGRLLAAGANDGTFTFLATETGLPVRNPLFHGNGVYSIDASPEGQRVVTGADDRTARLWTWHGDEISQPMLHEGNVAAARFSADGRLVATASLDGTARIWNAGVGWSHPGLADFPEPASAVAFASGSSRVAAAHGPRLRLWDPAAGRLLKELVLPGPIEALALSPDASRAAALLAGNRACLWDVDAGRALVPAFPAARGILLDPEGRTLAVVTHSRKVKLFDTATGRPLGAVPHQQALSGVAFHPSGDRLATASGGEIRLWDARSGEPVGAPFSQKERIFSLTFGAGGKHLATLGEGGVIRLWELGSRPRGASSWEQGWIERIVPHPDGERALVVAGNRARIHRLKTGEPVGQPMEHPEPVLFETFGADGEILVTATRSEIFLWKAATGEQVADSFEQESPVLALHLSPDGRALVSATSNAVSAWTLLAAEGNPDLLARLLEAVGGYRLNPAGALVPSDNRIAELASLRRQTADASPGNASFASFIHWFLADRRSRTISPFSNVTIPEHIRQRLGSPDPVLRRAVLSEFPGLVPSGAPPQGRTP